MSSSYDLLVVTDATGSMGSYLDSLRTSIPEIMALAKLSGVFTRLGVIAYKDYSEPKDQVALWSGWNADLPDFVQRLQPLGGGDYPEAAKTALIRALQAVDKESKTLILWYADAPPHHFSVQSINNNISEKNAFPVGATDWVKLCHMARKRNCTVFSFTPKSMYPQHSRFYTLLSELSGGISVKSNIKSNALISRLTLGIIMRWMGQQSDLETVIKESDASFMQYVESPLQAIPRPSDEESGSRGYLPSPPNSIGRPMLRKIVTRPLESLAVPHGSFATEPSNLAKRFADPVEKAYRDLVYEALGAIIEFNVFSLTYNPIFGQLWRAVCKDTNDKKIELLNAFSGRVGKVTDPAQKAGLQQWLEESFDATEEIEGIITQKGTAGPMVYLDLDADVELTRTELLEVSRSCYAGVLKKVASVFTHLKLADPAEIMLAPNQRFIPLSLAPCDFFRILPHLVVRGTLYPRRASSITAILALITGVPFLRESATALLKPLKGTWLDVEVPENISFDCARLLLSAPKGLVLTKDEKRVYESMSRYKLIELNLDSSINVSIPWTPEKTRGVGDIKIQCKKCLTSRSVTLMNARQVSVCGICIPDGKLGKKDPRKFPAKSELESCWVECSTKSCRAQYVIEDVSGLRIRPRCYYCRNKIPCPWLECAKCASRVIVPVPYRSAPDRKNFVCPACSDSESTIVTITPYITAARELNRENGVAWLGLPSNKDILEGKSAFKLFQTHGVTVFGAPPLPDKLLTLAINGKKIHSPGQALAQVERRVGTGEVELGSCALCFDEMSKTKLTAACGRSGCSQRVDDHCLREWYGKSEPGKLLNLMQLACPFCRRKPTIKTLARYNPHAAALGGLQQAMNDRRFFYAWCLDCGFAKPAHERVCCEGDRVPVVEDFRCDECTRPPPVAHTTNSDLGRVTSCPKCGVMVEKIYGCNHITCQCGQHFCHLCGQGFSRTGVYVHMSMDHGGGFDTDDE